MALKHTRLHRSRLRGGRLPPALDLIGEFSVVSKLDYVVRSNYYVCNPVREAMET